MEYIFITAIVTGLYFGMEIFLVLSIIDFFNASFLHDCIIGSNVGYSIIRAAEFFVIDSIIITLYITIKNRIIHHFQIERIPAIIPLILAVGNIILFNLVLPYVAYTYNPGKKMDAIFFVSLITLPFLSYWSLSYLTGRQDVRFVIAALISIASVFIFANIDRLFVLLF